MPSKRRRVSRMLRWRRYQDRLDRLVSDEHRRTRIGHPIRTNPGFFRAEGWDTDSRHGLRHGS